MTERTDAENAEVEAPILGPPDMNSCLTGKDLILGKTRGPKEKGMTADEMLDGITNSMDEFEQTREDSEG